MEFGKKTNSEEEISDLVKAVKMLTQIKVCRRPCCVDMGEETDQRLNKARNLMNSKTVRPNTQNVYKTDKSE